MNSKNQEIKTRTLEEYKLVMSLRQKNKRGVVRISRITGIPKDTIGGWLYRGAKPKRLRKIKLLPTSAKILSPELAYILGVIQGDACLCKARRHLMPGENYDYVLVLSVTDKDFADYFSEQVERWSGYIPYRHFRKQKGKGWKDIYSARLRSKDAYEFLSSFDLNKIKEANIETKAMFLRGFYDSEGSVDEKSKSIHVGVIEKEIILLVRRLLASLGITYGSLHEKITEKYKPFYYFIIASAESLALFKDRVGFSIKRKQDILNEINCEEIISKKQRFSNDLKHLYNFICQNPGCSLYGLSKKLNWKIYKTDNCLRKLLKDNKIYKEKNIEDNRGKLMVFQVKDNIIKRI